MYINPLSIMHVVTPLHGLSLMIIYALYGPLWLLFGGPAILRTAVFWGGEDHGLGEGGQKGDT